MNRWLYILGFVAFATMGLSWLVRSYPHVIDNPMNQPHFISLVVIISWMSLNFLSRKFNGRQVLHDAVMWLGIGGVLLIGYSYKDQLYHQLFPSRAIVSAQGELRFTQNNDGHFYIEALVNNKRLRFLVDTGASRVIIPSSYSEMLGIDPKDIDYIMPMSTANGLAMGAPVTFRKIDIAGHIVYDVLGSLSRDGLDEPLLGMSFLNRLKAWRIEGNVLILNP